MKGNVKWFDNKKGYGFITPEKGQDLFVHHSSIKANGFRSLQEGDAVEFEIEETQKGKQAINVKRV